MHNIYFCVDVDKICLSLCVSLSFSISVSLSVSLSLHGMLEIVFT